MVDAQTSWHPIAAADDLPLRHVFHGQLLGRELAVWRADDNFVNVWENRCLHRGVRLSIGTNNGMELTCRYHGWRYSNRSAGCTYIPAHPADAPARTISNRTFPAAERYGLVWSGEAPEGDVPTVGVLEEGSPFTLRSLPVNASAEVTFDELRIHTFQPCGAHDHTNAAPIISIDQLDDRSIVLTSTSDDLRSTVVFFVQPVDAGRSVIRPVLSRTPDQHEQIGIWRHHALMLASTVARAEKVFADQPDPPPMVAAIDEVPVDLRTLPDPSTNRQAPLRVQVSRKWPTATGVAAFELTSIGAPLPAFQPGAHIDVHLSNGLIRQYSLTNGPGETAHYRIGVKLEPDSRGGSELMHQSVREGDVLAISEPRNNFPLRRDSLKTILIAGGIGVTPLLAMAQALHSMDLEFELHYFARSEDHLAFGEVRDLLAASVTTHLALSPSQTAAAIEEIVRSPQPTHQLYVCGPGPMLESTRTLAARAGWADETIHFEYFKNTTRRNDSSTFEIALARSATTLQVPSGTSILQVLRENDVALPSSCEQGACGTCVVSVIDGDIDHQDVHLNETERAAGDQIMTCVSRATSPRLVLDL